MVPLCVFIVTRKLKMCHQIFMAVKVLDISIDYQTNKDNSTTTKDASKHDENMFTTVCDVFRLNSV